MNKISLFLMSICVALVLNSCAGGQGGMFALSPLEIKQADTRFSEQNNLVYFTRNNRISTKSIAGGIHIDATGIFINPTVTKLRETGEILLLGFSIENFTNHSTLYGSPNTLGAMEKITFLLNGTKSIILPIKHGDVKWADTVYYNNVSKSASSEIIESGLAFISVEQYMEIVSSKSVAVQIQGSKRIVVYEANDISDTFIPNLKKFIDEVQPYKEGNDNYSKKSSSEQKSIEVITEKNKVIINEPISEKKEMVVNTQKVMVKKSREECFNEYKAGKITKNELLECNKK